jgi:ATP-dependent protease HslVU (ClpYQ) peptidase subunit
LTIIVAVEHKDGVVVACDSQVTDTGTSFLMHKSQKKVGHRGPYIIGTAGRLRTGQVLLNADDLPVPNEGLSDEELNSFMITKFAHAAQEAMKESGTEQVLDHERMLTESELIVCVQGRSYMIGSDYSVMRAGDASKAANGIAIAGSGFQFALGAYYALSQRNRKIDPLEVATTMVEAALRWDQYCGGDIEVHEQPR